MQYADKQFLDIPEEDLPEQFTVKMTDVCRYENLTALRYKLRNLVERYHYNIKIDRYSNDDYMVYNCTIGLGGI